MTKSNYLWLGGWLENSIGGWHPPHCTAGFRIDVAYRMAKRDEERGLRMTLPALVEYHEYVGLKPGPLAEYEQLAKSMEAATP